MTEELTRLNRVSVEALDEILGVAIPVLDDGFVRVVDYLGSDESIVQAARISYGAGTKLVHKDRGLIRYLMRHRHTTPFEMCEIKLHVRVPMDCWRQWVRHRTANINEYSTRYSQAIDAAQRTPPGAWRLQAGKNRQGSSGSLDPSTGSHLSSREEEVQRLARDVYEERVAAGVAREQARKDLPLSTYTEAYWKIDLHNLLHFLSLRMKEKSQDEIRTYATTIGREIVAKWCPITWEAFVDYRMESLTLSRLDVEVIRALVAGGAEAACEPAKTAGLLARGKSGWQPSREREELEAKLDQLGLRPPWKDSEQDAEGAGGA